MAIQTGKVLGCVTRCIAQRDIRTASYELFRRWNVTTGDSFMQGGIALVICCRDLGTVASEQPDSRDIAKRCHPVER
jgi:hypothetical protein